MVATVSAIAAGVAMKGQLFFDPSVPQSAMVHCYLRGDAGLLEACHVREQPTKHAPIRTPDQSGGADLLHRLGCAAGACAGAQWRAAVESASWPWAYDTATNAHHGRWPCR
eukprot:720164-Prymnesium_polylepis.1